MEIGVDIEEISRFEGKTLENDSTFLNKIFTENELDYCFSKSLPAQHLAARFCAKEAAIKALNNLTGKIVPHSKIEVINKTDGSPCLNLIDEKNINIKVSLSHTKIQAIAFVVAEMKV